jgi:hypothetical protein
MKPSFQPEMHYVPFEKRRTRRVTRTLMILMSLVIAIGIVFHLATSPTLPLHTDATTDHVSQSLITLKTMYTSLHMLKNGDQGYIAVEDIQSHPLLHVYIAPNVLVSRVPDQDRIVHLTIIDDVIVLDPISVQQALRYVVVGPDTHAKTVLLSSTA